ncbi:MAG: tryptophan--tRNA ligase [Clostridiales bacterium]|nr:tryptophan--tRNA ligase [Clostridiales bacterium]
MKRILTGLQPTGKLTLGNLIGGINQIKKYQNEFDSFIFVPDMHSITIEQNPIELRKNIISTIALYLACGIDKDKNTFYIQSENLYHANLSWILECNVGFGQLSRMTQFKDKSQKKINVTCGLFTYPVLMAADILLYSANFVPTGIDQKQHVELARDIAECFNKKYGNTFVVPEPIIPQLGAKIMDLQNPLIKMSKSAENEKGVIYLLDTEDVIRKKVKSAVTDSDNKVCYDSENKPGVSNLLTIYACLNNLCIIDAEKHFENYQYGAFKSEVAESIINTLKPIQEKYYEILNSNLIEEVLKNGYSKVLEISKEKYNEVKNKVGLGRIDFIV